MSRTPYLVSGLGHAVVLGLALTLAALHPMPRIVPGVKIVALSGRLNGGAKAVVPAPPTPAPPQTKKPEPPPPAPKTDDKKPVEKAPPKRDAAKPPDPKGVKPPQKQEIVSKTPSKTEAAPPSSSTKPAKSNAPSSPATSAAKAGAGSGTQSGVGIEAEGDAGMASEYLSLLRDKVAANWAAPPVTKTGEVRAVVFFTILRGGGAPQGLTVQVSSGESGFDRAAMRAVLDASPIPPLPQQWPHESISIKFTFFQQY